MLGLSRPRRERSRVYRDRGEIRTYTGRVLRNTETDRIRESEDYSPIPIGKLQAYYTYAQTIKQYSDWIRYPPDRIR